MVCSVCKQVHGPTGFDNLKIAHIGFPNENAFVKHRKNSKNCPSKDGVAVTATTTDIPEPAALITKWNPYISSKDCITAKELKCDQKILDLQLEKHIYRKGCDKWFPSTIKVVDQIVEKLILNPDCHIGVVAAEPGSGKSMCIHYLIYKILNLPHDNCILGGNITLTTNMSDIDWLDTIIGNLKLKSGEYLWKEAAQYNVNHCIVHRPRLKQRVAYLNNNLDLLSNHVFIIDESHFADGPKNTFAKELRELGLTPEKMKTYNIKFLLVSATHDVTLSLLLKEDAPTARFALENGPGYKGFGFFLEKGWIVDYTEDFNPINMVLENFTSPRYHDLRIMVGEARETMITEVRDRAWVVIEDDSVSKPGYYHSFVKDDAEREAVDLGKKVIKFYEAPARHTFIFIKHKHRASKRLSISPFLGLVAEKPAQVRNVTVTANALIPRFWGYSDLPEFEDGQHPIFVCDLDAVESYKKFVDNHWIYDKTSYAGTKITSTDTTVKEKKQTYMGTLAGVVPETRGLPGTHSVARAALRIPIIIRCDKNDKIFTGETGQLERIEYCRQWTNSDEFRKLHDFINHCTPNLDTKNSYLTRPTAPGSIDRHITTVIKKAEAGEVFIVDHTNKTTNNWQCFIDIHGGNLCFCVYSIDNTYLDRPVTVARVG